MNTENESFLFTTGRFSSYSFITGNRCIKQAVSPSPTLPGKREIGTEEAEGRPSDEDITDEEPNQQQPSDEAPRQDRAC